MKKLLLPLLFFLTTTSLLSHAVGNISTYGDFLLWHASEETSATWATALSSSDNKVNGFTAVNVLFGWRPGFRAGFNYELADRLWDIQVCLTYFATKKSTSVSLPDQILLPEFFNGFLSGNFFFGAALNWKLLMNMIDVEIGRRFNVVNCLSIRPAIGLKGGIINQKMHSTWDAGIYTATEDLKNNFFGLGPSFSIDGEWNIYKNLDIIGDVATALMWGHWHIEDTYRRPEALFGIVTPTTIASNSNNSMLGVPMFRCFMGLKWVYEAKVCVAIQAGYEMQFWANQLRMPTFQQLPVHGDLTLQGGTCRICIDF